MDYGPNAEFPAGFFLFLFAIAICGIAIVVGYAVDKLLSN